MILIKAPAPLAGGIVMLVAGLAGLLSGLKKNEHHPYLSQLHEGMTS